jgi:hypothetical protein
MASSEYQHPTNGLPAPVEAALQNLLRSPTAFPSWATQREMQNTIALWLEPSMKAAERMGMTW